ncbi:(E2-independent) E3 ubiquitin-conjugating enzyme FATS isoform X2 [Cololabis saira]|uniref:(E2-independent) E3 ubiquitin-conjugating enzyme FATS isoform X2 n=1 Tax=Cololabis saira TaxID=129043 RepID=UPI002AD35467|nr:(E2-independent) E3 ubiquitin-conjugating enzyme FATS isoform X2 [Cololabis saira]
MTLRRPAGHLRRSADRRRSGDELYWESLIAEDQLSSGFSHPQRAPRPQSAVEGSQLDKWLEHLRAIQSRPGTQVHNPSDRTTFVPAFDKARAGSAERRSGTPSFSRDSSSCGSSSLCESSLGSQESLQTWFFPSIERRRSWERAHIMQAPRKEKAQFSYLAPVRIGWLPIRRRVMKVEDTCGPNQLLDHSSDQLKMKQAITPTFQKNQAAPYGGEGEESHSSRRALSVKTWQTPDQGSPALKEVPGKPGFTANEEDRPFSWQVLRRGWNGELALPGRDKFNDHPAGTNSNPNRESPLINSSGREPSKHLPLHRTTSADPCRRHARLPGTNREDALKPHAPLQRTNSLQPVKATYPACGKNSGTHSSHVETHSAETTLIPQNKAGISSITISSRKVTRSASLPASHTCGLHSNSSKSPLNHQPMDPNSRQLTVQRKATIVKVTEKRVISSTSSSTRRERTPPVSYGLDTVVRRRKATIIKVTDHKESYSPVKLGSRYPEHRHSFTEGAWKVNSTWSPGNRSVNNASPSHHLLNSTVPNAFSLNAEKRGPLHRSTLNLFLNNQPVKAAPGSSEVSPAAVGQRPARPRRPLSCYGDLTGHSEPCRENDAQTAAGKRASGPPWETYINPANSDSSLISSRKSVKEAGQRGGESLKPNRDEKEILSASVNGLRRASPSVTLIKAPDPLSHQSQEEVLALNAAAIIANIKLQRRLSKKEISSGDSEKDCTASPGGNIVMDEWKCGKTDSDQSEVREGKEPPRAAFVPLKLDNERSPETVSLQTYMSPALAASAAEVPARLHQSLPGKSGGAGAKGTRAEAAVEQSGRTGGRRTQAEGRPQHPGPLSEW